MTNSAATNSAAKVTVGKPLASGGAFRAPVGTDLPTGVMDQLDEAFQGTGYVSSDGVVQAIENDSEAIVAWGGNNVRQVQTSHDVTYALTMIETNEVSQKVFYGDDNVEATAADATHGNRLDVKITSAELPRAPWVFELSDSGRRGRIVLPDAQVTERGEVSMIDEDAMSYPITLTAYPDDDGVKAYIYWDDGQISGV